MKNIERQELTAFYSGGPSRFEADETIDYLLIKEAKVFDEDGDWVDTVELYAEADFDDNSDPEYYSYDVLIKGILADAREKGVKNASIDGYEVWDKFFVESLGAGRTFDVRLAECYDTEAEALDCAHEFPPLDNGRIVIKHYDKNGDQTDYDFQIVDENGRAVEHDNRK